MSKKHVQTKRILAMLLVLVMLFALLPPLPAAAVEAEPSPVADALEVVIDPVQGTMAPVVATQEATRPQVGAAHTPVDVRDHDSGRSQAPNAADTMNGPTFNSFGGTFAMGDYLAFPGQEITGDMQRFMLLLSAPAGSNGHIIEIRSGSPTGTLIGAVEIRSTRGPEIFWPHFADVNAIAGTQDVYLVFPQATEVDFDFFVFSEYYFERFGYDEPDVSPQRYEYKRRLMEAEMESGRFDERMQWWRDATFGMFIHFGPYAYAGGRTLDRPGSGNGWNAEPFGPGRNNLQHIAGYPDNLAAPGVLGGPRWRWTGAQNSTSWATRGQAEWIMHNPHQIPRDVYEHYIVSPFNPEDWDAEEIVRLAQEAGMHYIVITARHHDGFSIYDTQVRYHRDRSITAANHGTFERDLLMELALATQATYDTDHPVRLGAFITLPDWSDPTQYVVAHGARPAHTTGAHLAPFNGATPDEQRRSRDDYVARMMAQMRELIVDYGIHVVWFDDANRIRFSNEQSYALYNFARALNPDIITNNRHTTYRGQGAHTRTGVFDFDTPEHRLMSYRPENDFEVCYTLNDSWGFSYTDVNWKSAARVVEMLTQTAGLNGNLLLNIGPDGRGDVPMPSQNIFRQVGEWMAPVGESFHGTRGGFHTVTTPERQGELPAGVFATVREDSEDAGRMFLHLLPHFTGSTLLIPAPTNQVLSARIMNTDTPISFVDAGGFLFFNLSDITRNPMSTVIEVSVDGGMPTNEPDDDNGGPDPAINIAYTEFQAGRMSVTAPPHFPLANQADTRFIPENMFNGITTAPNNAQAGVFWAAAAPGVDAEIDLTFTNDVTVNQAVLYVRNTGNQLTFDIEVQWWNQAESAWETVGASRSGVARAHNTRVEIDFDRAVTGDEFRVFLPGSSEPSIIEIQMFYDPVVGDEEGIAITAPTAGATVPTGSFNVSGTLEGTPAHVTVQVIGEGISVSVPAEITGNTWSVQIDTTGWARYINPLSILAMFHDGERYVKLAHQEVVYGVMPNYALGRPAMVSSVWNDNWTGAQRPEHLTDGEWGTNASSRWAPHRDDIQPWLIVPLAERTEIDRVIIHEWVAQGARVQGFVIEVSNDADGDDWVIVYEGNGIGANGEFAFDPVEALRVRVTFLGWGDINPAGGQPSIHQVRIFARERLHTAPLYAAIAAAANYPGVRDEDLTGHGYLSETYVLYFAALEAAQATLRDAQTQAELNEALRNLQISIRNLRRASDDLRPIHTVSFHLNGGVRVGAAPELVQYVRAGEAVLSPTVTREGLHFVGWSRVYDPATASMVVVAQWSTEPFVAVTEITKTSATTVEAGTALTLLATVAPENATNRDIVWSTESAGATIVDGVLTATAAGSVVVTARIVDGTAIGTDFTQEFTIIVGSTEPPPPPSIEIELEVADDGAISIAVDPADTDYDVTVEDGAIVITLPPDADVDAGDITVPDGWEVTVDTDEDDNVIVTLSPPDGYEVVDEDGNLTLVEVAGILWGDANGDGVVDILDVIRLRQYLAGDPVEIHRPEADADGNGVINILDVIRLQQYLAGDSVILGPAQGSGIQAIAAMIAGASTLQIAR